MRILRILSVALLLFFGTQLVAGEKVAIGTPAATQPSSKQAKKWYYPFEIGELKIRQSNDGTGIIQNVSCPRCDYQFVKITRGTQVIVNGRKASLLRARERAGKPAYIEFDKDTAEVKYVYWAE